MPKRWTVLLAYALVAASTQLLWLSFAPVDTAAARAMHVDVGSIGDLALIFPLVYVVLALPTGRWLDSNFNTALAAGAVLTGVGGLGRLVAPTSFGVQLAGQVVISIGQPLVLNSVTKLAAHHFPPGERATAISVGSVALFAGILAAVLAGGPLFSAGGLPLLLGVEAVPAVLGMALLLGALRIKPAYADDVSTSVNLRWLARDGFMWVLAALIFIGMGTYNAVATWLQPILDHYGHGADAGNLVAVMTVGGIVGAAFIPSASAARNWRRPVLLLALAVTAVSFLAMDVVHDSAWIGGWLLLQGIFLMACLPIVLDWSELHSGPERAGAAAGFLLMAGNLGGVVLVLVVQVVMGTPSLPFIAMAVAALLAVPLALRLPAGGGAAPDSSPRVRGGG